MRPRLRLDVSAAQRFILRGLNEKSTSASRQEPAAQPRVTSATSANKKPQQQQSKSKKDVGLSVYRQLSVLRADRDDWSELDRCRAIRVDRYVSSVATRRAESRHNMRMHNK